MRAGAEAPNVRMGVPFAAIPGANTFERSTLAHKGPADPVPQDRTAAGSPKRRSPHRMAAGAPESQTMKGVPFGAVPGANTFERSTSAYSPPGDPAFVAKMVAAGGAKPKCPPRMLIGSVEEQNKGVSPFAVKNDVDTLSRPTLAVNKPTKTAGAHRISPNSHPRSLADGGEPPWQKTEQPLWSACPAPSADQGLSLAAASPAGRANGSVGNGTNTHEFVEQEHKGPAEDAIVWRPAKQAGKATSRGPGGSPYASSESPNGSAREARKPWVPPPHGSPVSIRRETISYKKGQ